MSENDPPPATDTTAPNAAAAEPAPAAQSMAEPVQCLDDVRFHYPRGRPVLRGVSASLYPGRVTALVGPNAAGKSTLVRLMLGAMSPAAGRVIRSGLDVAMLRPANHARWISYVPQRTGTRFAFTVRQVVAMGRHGAGDAAQRSAEIAGLIDDADLRAAAGRPVQQFSGGQQQRVHLARAQAQALGSGRVMLLDEPASHLDLRHAHTTMLRLYALASRGLAVPVVGHDLNLALRYADDCWLMNEGVIAKTGQWRDVLTPEVLASVYGVALHQTEPDPADPAARPTLVVGPGAEAATMQVRERGGSTPLASRARETGSDA